MFAGAMSMNSQAFGTNLTMKAAAACCVAGADVAAIRDDRAATIAIEVPIGATTWRGMGIGNADKPAIPSPFHVDPQLSRHLTTHATLYTAIYNAWSFSLFSGR